MKLLNWRTCLLLASAAFLGGCGKEERSEAARFAKVLADETATFASANSTERDFVNNARAWCGGITTNGAGRGVELDQNAAVAAELGKSVVAISSQLSVVRQAINRPSLTRQYPRDVRAELTDQLTKRQRMLQELRVLFEQAAPQFLEYKQNKAYVGDTYPDGVAKLDALLRTYSPPNDAVGAALTALQTKYRLGKEL